MRVEMDSGPFVTGCSYLYDLNHDVVDTMSTLTNALDACGAMAGGDTSGEAWAAQYDPAAAKAVQAGCDLGDAGAHLANLTDVALVNHRAADGGAMLSGPPELQRSDGDENPDHYGESISAPAPPTAKGGTGDVPGWWHWVAGHLEGWFWPDADTGRLRSAGAAWAQAASELTATTYLIDGAIGDYLLITSPEVNAANRALTDLKGHVTDLASAFGDLGEACTQYAQDVDDKHHEIEEASTADAMAAVRTMGAQGERDAQIVKNSTRIPAPSGKAAYRIPDELTSTQLGEVKNVAKQGWSSQMSDFYDYASSQVPPLKMVIYVRQNTQIVGKLAQLVADGDITVIRKLPAVK
ncbi:MAG: putative toxin [Nocardioides sp.]